MVDSGGAVGHLGRTVGGQVGGHSLVPHMLEALSDYVVRRYISKPELSSALEPSAPHSLRLETMSGELNKWHQRLTWK